MSGGTSPRELVKLAGFDMEQGGAHSFAEALIEASGFFVPTLPRAPLKTGVQDAQFQETIRFILTGMQSARAAKTAGIPRSTWKTALRKGQKDAENGESTRESTIWRTVSRAEGVMLTYLNATLIRHAAKDLRAAVALRDSLMQEDHANETELVEEADSRQAQRERLRLALPKHSEDFAVIDADPEDFEDVD